MSTHICTIGAEASQITCLSWKNSVSSSVCVAMDGVAESEHHAPSLDISPAPTHQQGMSPSHAGATAGFDAQSNAGDTLVVAGSQGVSNEGVAMRAMAVSVTTGQNQVR